MAASFFGRSVLRSKTKNLLVSPCRNGYIVLVPEVPENLPKENFKDDGLPEISSLTTDKCVGAIGKLTLEYESEIWKIESSRKSSDEPPKDVFAEVLDPLEIAGTPVDTTWGLMKTLYLSDKELMPSKVYLGIHDKARRARAAKFNSPTIYQACKQVNKESLSEEQKRVVGKFVLEGRLNGLELSIGERASLGETLNKLGMERAKFKSKVEAATKAFKQNIIDPNIMRDFPEPLLRTIAVDKTQFVRGPWTVTLEPHVANAFLEHCPIPMMRWNVWNAGVSRCSGYGGDKAYETSGHVEEIRYLRRDQARLLGFETYADMSMETKMAGSRANVSKMISSLRNKAAASQEAELNSLEEFAASRGFDGSMQIYDVPYWRRKQQKALFAHDEEHLREFFPLPRVLSGLFALLEATFSLAVVQRPNADAWHPDVAYYDIVDAKTGRPLGGFYLDPYQRDTKLRTLEDAGWMVALVNRSKVTGSTALASLVFNFQQPLYGKPSLLTFREVKLLFQKFGHALQHVLSTASYAEVSGLSNIEWDAVEVCAHFMTHWLYDEATMASIGSHYESGEPIPAETLTKLGKVRSHMAGYDLCRELYLASLDLELHSSKDFWLDVVKNVWPQFSLFPLDKQDSHPCSFTAIFSEEWAAAYYCHLWARIVAADAFSAFLEVTPAERPAVGSRFRETYLSLGGSCHPSEVFRRFRGRDPSPNALLNTLGFRPLKM